MTILWLAFEGTWHVLLAGLILGAGLPAVFALGVRSLSLGSGGPGQRPSLLGWITAGVCFTVVLLAVLAGIATIIAHGHRTRPSVPTAAAPRWGRPSHAAGGRGPSDLKTWVERAHL